jgi:hypothetical protein
MQDWKVLGQRVSEHKHKCSLGPKQDTRGAVDWTHQRAKRGYGQRDQALGLRLFGPTNASKSAEMALSVLAYNLTRVMNIAGIKPLIAAIAA